MFPLQSHHIPPYPAKSHYFPAPDSKYGFNAAQPSPKCSPVQNDTPVSRKVARVNALASQHSG